MAESSRYQLKEVLGRGGMGVIVRARDTLMNRDVAVKTILDVSDRAARDLFYREWGIQASITHPNIAEIHDIGEMRFEGQVRPYFVMPLFRGATLADLLKNSPHLLTPERVIPILIQACRGLQAAHDRQLIHRDLKPSNIFVLEDDSVKLIDFGIAHAGGSAQTSIRGTLSYMAPELLDGKPATPSSDTFAMGVVSYEALTGRRPFTGPDDAAVAFAIRSQTPAPPGEIDQRLAGDLSRVIYRALAKQPWQRYNAIREYAEFLGRAARREPIELFDPARVKPRFEKAMRAFERADYSMATDIIAELEGEGNVDPEITALRRQIEQAQRGSRIRQYLENARRLFDEQEYSLALRKVQEALELDGTNADSLALKNEIEKKRRAVTAREWAELARRHLDNNAFSQARAVITNLLELRPDDPGALSLRVELERREAESGRLRGEKDRLQREAKGAWERGDVTSAMSNLERWMDMDRATPETDASRVASVRNLFVTVRTEHESIRNSYEQARALLEAGKFDEAAGICKLYLAKYPNHALFQAVRFDVDERRRQALSAYIAEIDQRASAESDLDRRVAILEDAARRYPEENHFHRALEPARSKRDLVNSIVARARLFEEEGKFGEALEQWELLGPVHGSYPGLEFEKERVRKRRETQSRIDAKAASIHQIERSLELGEYDRACADAARAETEFPGDPEVEEIGRIARSRQERGQRADMLVEEARTAAGLGEVTRSAELLRRALAEDERHPLARPLLAQTIAERARAAVDAGRDDEAEVYLNEAAEIDPNHALTRNLRAVLADRQRERAVSEVLAEARRLFNEKDLAGALEVCERAITRFPAEYRLMQLAGNLRAALEQRAEKARRAEAIAEPLPSAKPVKAAPVQPPALQPARPEPAPAPVPPPAPPPTPKTVQPTGKNVVPVAAAAAVCVTLLGGGAYFVTHRSAPPSPAVSDPAPPTATAPPAPKPVLPTIEIVNEAAGAPVLVNGAEAPPGSISTVAGPYTIELKGTGVTGKASFRVSEDGSVQVEGVPTGEGIRLILVDRGANHFGIHAAADSEVLIDGKPAPASGGLEEHTLEVRKAGEEPRSFQLPKLTASALQIYALRPGKPDFGTIVVSSNVDDLRVQVDAYPIPFAVKNGTALPQIPPGVHKVVVKRDGFKTPEPYTVTVKRGEDSLMKVHLDPVDATLIARGLPSGATLLIDGTPREVPRDGAIEIKLKPGDHSFELRRGNSRSKVQTRTARPAETVTLSAGDLVLITPTGTLLVEGLPPGGTITVRKEGESSGRSVTIPATLPEGSYTVTASAPGHSPAETRAVINGGRSITVSFRLNQLSRKEATAAPQPAPAPGDNALRELPGWRASDGWLKRRAGGFSPIATLRPGSALSFQASLPDGRRLQWMIPVDQKNFLLFKLERRKFIQTVSINGKQRTVAETPVEADLKSGVSVRVQWLGSKIVHVIGGKTVETEVPEALAAGGSFGFMIPGGDEFAVREVRTR